MDFIKQIRQADKSVRKRWLVIFSASTILVVVGIWLAYFNTILVAVNPPADEQLTKKSNPIPALGKKTITGLANSYVFFKDKVSDRNGFTISRANQNFIWDDLEKIPEQQLP